jgi:polyisoprenoid-binding protein YceI
MTTRYRFNTDNSRVTVQAFASGLLSFLGHDPIFVARAFTGVVEFEDDLIAKMRLDLTVEAGSLTVTGDLPGAARREMEDRMRAEVLETQTFPQIAFHASATNAERVGEGHYRMQLHGTLSLHGVNRPHHVVGELMIFRDGLRVRGEATVRMSEFNIRPVTALGGTLRLQDDVKLRFDITALPEKS